MSADKQLKAYIDRVLRLKEEQDTIGDDIREVYAEAKGQGYDKTVMGKLVAHLRKVAKSGEDAVSEQEMNFDTYLQAYHRASGTAVATHTHEEEFDPATGDFRENEYANTKLAHTVVTGMQTETGRAALTAAVDIMIAREEAEEQSQPETANEMDREEMRADEVGHSLPAENARKAIPETERGDVNHAGAGESPATHSPIAPAAHGEAEAPSAESVSPQAVATTGSSAANTGGGHVDDIEHATTHQAGALVEPAPAAPGSLTYEDFPPVPMKRTSFAHCFPELSARDYDALGTDIGLTGVQDPIVRLGNVILDGWARYNIARNLGIQYPVVEYDGEDELLDVIRWQHAARNFTPAQAKKIAADLAKEVPHRASEIMAAFEIEMEDA
jgi:uncharacterized protein (UPF0335 family)